MITFKQFLLEQESLPEKVNGKPTRNSEGKFIHHTIEGINNFWKWFSNSKTVDSKGRPIVFYHGSQHTKIKPNRNMLWFTEDKDGAVSYANKEERNGTDFVNGHVYLCYLKIQRLATREDIIKVAKDNYFIPKDDDEWFGFDLMDSRPELIEELKKQYDGVFIDVDYPYDNPQKEIKSYCVFSIKNVKSAIGNNGTFKKGLTENKQ